MVVNPQLVNPQDTAPHIQAAIKNTATGTVFYFTVPINLEAVLVSGVALDVQTYVSSWKSIDDSLEVSAIVNGKFLVILLLEGFRLKL